jgi:hypothetical protein
MAKSIDGVVIDLRELLNRSGKDAATIPWKKFYVLAGRERMKDAFMEELSKQAKAASMFVCYGNAVVLVAKDYDFSPV